MVGRMVVTVCRSGIDDGAVEGFIAIWRTRIVVDDVIEQRVT